MEIKIRLKCPTCRKKQEFIEEKEYYKCVKCGCLVGGETIRKKINIELLKDLIYNSNLKNETELKNILIKMLMIK